LNKAPNKEDALNFITKMNKFYIQVRDGKIVVDRNMANYDIVNYKIIHGTYTSQINMLSELGRNGISVLESTIGDSDTIPDVLGKDKVKFRDIFERYCTLMEDEILTESLEIMDIENRKPLVKQAYDTLGVEEVRRLKYHQSTIKREIIKRGPEKYAIKITQMLKLPRFESIPKNRIKKKIQAVYDDLGLNVKAKSTDLNKWYNTQETLKQEDGKNIACMKIIGDKLLIKDSY
jgi:hypothetical protein